MLYKNQIEQLEGEKIISFSTLEEFHIKKAIKERNEKEIENLCANKPEETMQIAAKNGTIHELLYLNSKGCIFSTDVFVSFTEKGDLYGMQWLRKNGCPWDERSFEVAARNGNLELLQWLKNPNSWDRSLWKFLSDRKLEVLKRLLLLFGILNEEMSSQLSCPWDERTFVAAMENGNLENIKWLAKNECPWDVRAIATAVRLERHDVINWLVHNGFDLNEERFERGVVLGDVTYLNWLKENNAPMNEDAMNIAIWTQKNNVISWMMENGFEITEKRFESAIKEKNLEYINWVLGSKCPLKEEVMAMVVKQEGNSDIINIFIENGFQLNVERFEKAILLKDLEYIEWLKKMNCPFNYERIFGLAEASGDSKIMDWVLNNLKP
jgi:hypothetical protein